MTEYTLKYGKWEEVYSVELNQKTLWMEPNPELQDGTIYYYQTFGGGPEGGYFVKVVADPNDEFAFHCAGVWRAQRNWFQTWQIEKIPNTTLQFQDAREMEGRTARCRLVTRQYKTK